MTDRRLDPEIARLIAAGGATPLIDGSPNIDALRGVSAARASSHPPTIDGGTVRDAVAHLDGRSLGVRIYRGGINDCIVVFFHGGGFVKGDLDTQDSQARMLCDMTGRSVVSIDYRLAPEHRFPAAYDDAVDSVRWVHAHAPEILDTTERAIQVAVAGPSVGANLAVGAALALAGTAAAPVAQVLAYPLLSGDCDMQSRSEFAEGFGLTSAAIEWLIQQYVTDQSDRSDPRFAPLLSATLGSLPPTVVLGAGLDPLRDEARVFAERLRVANVPVQQFEEPTLPHGFLKYALHIEAARSAAFRMCNALREILDGQRRDNHSRDATR